MGNANYRAISNPPQDPKIYFQNDLPKFILQSKIGNSKFMKSYNMRVDGIPMVVKVYIRLNDEELVSYASRLSYLWKVLSPSKHPNLMPYQCWIKSNVRAKPSGSPVYLIRQFLNANLYDRLSTRPFLHDFEKLWIIFQLMKCLEICHDNKVVHGDIKPENIMVTTWNWVILTDFASFKPATIPDDDLTDFQYFFDTMGRRRCSVAPERFVKKVNTIANSKSKGDDFLSDNGDSSINSKNSMKSSLTVSMDVFSLGCTIAEVFMDGEPLLDLPGMLKYAAGASLNSKSPLKSSPINQSSSGHERLDLDESPAKALLLKISNKLIRQVVVDMTQRDPDARLSVKQYRLLLQGGLTTESSSSVTQTTLVNSDEKKIPIQTAFPLYFESTLYPLFLNLHWKGHTPDDRIGIICESYGDLIKDITDINDEQGKLFFSTAMLDIYKFREENIQNSEIKEKVIQEIKRNSLLRARTSLSSTNSKLDDISDLLNHLKLPDNNYSKSLSLLNNGSNNILDKPESSSISSKEKLDDLIIRCKSFLNDIEMKYKESNNNDIQRNDNDIKADKLIDDSISLLQNYDTYTNNGTFFHDWINKTKGNNGKRIICNGLVIIIQIIVSQYRNLKHPHSRIVSLMLLIRFGLLCSDDIIIQRIIPILMYSLDDANAYVRATSIRALKYLLLPIKIISSYESNIFPNYIIPSISKLAKDPEIIVRVAFAESIGIIAEASKKFLDRSHFMIQNKIIKENLSKDNLKENLKDNIKDTDQLSISSSGGNPTNSESESNNLDSSIVVVEFPYDSKLKLLHEQVSRWIRDLVIDTNNISSSSSANNSEYRRGSGLCSQGSMVKRAILVDLMRLCTFFGQESTMDMLLTQLLTFLNDQDWELRYAFCAKISSVCIYLGKVVTSECVLPCIENALVDVEEKVIACALQSLTFLINTNLLSTVVIVDLIDNILPLLYHPSNTIREVVVDLIIAICNSLGNVYSSIYVLNKLHPIYIKHDIPVNMIIKPNVLKLLLHTKISRTSYNKKLFDIINPVLLLNNKIERESEANFGLNINNMSDGGTYFNNSKEYNDEDNEKLQIVNKYLVRVGQEMITKIKQWRNAISSNNTNTIGYTAILGRNVLYTNNEVKETISLDKMIPLIDHNIQSIYIPHSKFSNGYIPLWNEEKRIELMKHFIDNKITTSQIRMLFNIINKLSDVARTLNSNTSNSNEPIEISNNENEIINRSTSFSTTNSNTNNNSKVKVINIDSSTLVNRIKALGLPPIPPDLGVLIQPDERKFNSFIEPLDTSVAPDANFRQNWRPRENILAASLLEHKHSVNRVAISQDQTYFVTASSDYTAKIWQVKGLDKVAFPRSVATYNKHKGGVLDVITIDNSHSVATASDDGTVHIWRVDLQSNSEISTTLGDNDISTNGNNPSSNIPTLKTPGVSICGYSMIRTLDPADGAIVSVQHFYNDVASIVIYTTQKGIVHGWDLRSCKTVFTYTIRPELGYPTTTAISSDKNWFVLGTSLGYITLWDLRYNIMSKLWKLSTNSPIYRLACCKYMPIANATNSSNSGINSTEGAYLIVSSGNNETAIYNLPEGGECLKCFRAIPKSSTLIETLKPLPTMTNVQFSSHPLVPVVVPYSNPINRSYNYHTIRAVIGRMSKSNESHLITGGTDKQLRFWDFISPTKCYTVSGLEPSQQKPTYDAPESYQGKLFVSYDTDLPSTEAIVQAQLPMREGRGPMPPANNFKDAIVDLKTIDIPIRLMISSSKDGTVKLWR